ncbi:MAG: bifunctional oligoribonuclease/PAP phosphatase NrnA [Clostridia bacterium]|nr:bifunctional oligoribonuclease/PAP phosphatase NrnA [Clostridia bacterium]
MKVDLKQLTKYNRIAIATHSRPDGDAIGSSIGLYYGFLQLGKEVEMLCENPVPKKMRFLWGADKFKQTASGKYDLVVFCDCSDISRVGDINLDVRNCKVIAIDHHEGAQIKGENIYIDPKSPSASQLVLDVLRENNIPLNKDVANAIYTGLLTDTGKFANTNVNAKVFTDAAYLVENGAEPSVISARVFDALEGNKYKIIAKALTDLKRIDNGRIAYYYLSTQTLNSFDSTIENTEGVISYALNIEGVQIAIGITDGKHKNEYKISLRSVKEVDVSRLANYFGGGGHKQASGCVLCGDYYDVLDRILFEAQKYTV